MKEDHYILGAGGPLGQCSRKLISNPDLYCGVHSHSSSLTLRHRTYWLSIVASQLWHHLKIPTISWSISHVTLAAINCKPH